MSARASLKSMRHGSHFRAFSLHGGQPDVSIDPFLAVDHAWISGPTFAPHPHAGFSAVSYLFADSQTAIDNRDSLGNRNLIRPGGLHWTAAGKGIVHEEVPNESGKTVHMLQIFINLPLAFQEAAPFALSLAPEDVPVLRLPGAEIRVPLGAFLDTRSPLDLPTDVSLLDISIKPRHEVRIPVASGESAFVMPIDGDIWIDDQRFTIDNAQVPVSLAIGEAHSITLRATDTPAHAVVFRGVPLHQPVYWQGPLALASSDALKRAVAAYQRGEFGTLQPR